MLEASAQRPSATLEVVRVGPCAPYSTLDLLLVASPLLVKVDQAGAGLFAASLFFRGTNQLKAMRAVVLICELLSCGVSLVALHSLQFLVGIATACDGQVDKGTWVQGPWTQGPSPKIY